MVICLEQGPDLHMAQLMPLPLTVSCFSKIQTGFTFLVPAHRGSPGQRAVKWVCVCVCVCVSRTAGRLIRTRPRADLFLGYGGWQRLLREGWRWCWGAQGTVLTAQPSLHGQRLVISAELGGQSVATELLGTDGPRCSRLLICNTQHSSMLRPTAGYMYRIWRRGVVVSGVRRMNKVNVYRARLVLGWVTIFGQVYHLGK